MGHHKHKKEFKGVCISCGQTVYYHRGEKQKNCPHCGFGNDNYDWKKPEIETELFILQKKYLESKDLVILGKMKFILQEYAKGKIKNLLSGKVLYDEEVINERANDSANMLITYYLTKPDFKIETSFGGYLLWQIKSVLYNKKQKEIDDVGSIHDVVLDVDEEELDHDSIGNMQYMFRKDDDNVINLDFIKKQEIQKGVEEIIFLSIAELRKQNSSLIAFKVLLGVYYYVQNIPEERKNAYYDVVGRYEVKDYVDKVMMLVLDYIKSF